MLENIASVNLIELIEGKATEAQLRSIKEITKIMHEGTMLKDALILCRLNQAIWDKWLEDIPEIDQLIVIQRLEYKQKLMRVLNNQAIEKHDFKLALQLLVSAFPQEFNPAIQKEQAKKSPIDPEENSMQQLFQMIQSSTNELIGKEAENKSVTTDKNHITKTLADILQ